MSVTAQRSESTKAKARFLLLAPPLAALLYPFALKAFNASVTLAPDGDASAVVFSRLSAGLYLALGFAMPLVAMLAAMSLSELEQPTTAQVRAKRVALLAVAAPTIFTFGGVILYMLRNPVSEIWLWIACWALVIAVLVRPDDETPARVAARQMPAPLRAAHGLSALALVFLFLSFHVANHLMFPAGPEKYNAAMKVFRHIYRTEIVQPVLVTLFLFQIGTGLLLAWRQTMTPADRFRTFQIASGVYLGFYVLGHMDSVFIFARTYLGIDTGWSFATGAPAGLVKDPWNIRLVPHYWLGVFFVLAHLAAGARVVLMNHGVRKVLADRLMIGSAVVAGIIATVIMLGMCGLRVQFV